MRLGGESDSPSEPKEEESPRDLLCGLGPWHIHVLCMNSWEGGRQYTPSQVGDLTLDEAFMLLADKKMLRKSGKRRTMKTDAIKTDADGFVHGRTKDGEPIKGRVRGKSVARQLMEEEEAKKAAAAQPQGRRRRRRGGQ